MSFPIAPTNGQQTIVNGIRYYYSSAYSAWIRITSAKFTAAATGPSDPAPGDEWYDTNEDVLYKYLSDGTTSYWIDIQTLGITSFGSADTVLNANITVGTSNVYSIGTSTGYLANLYAGNVTANTVTANVVTFNTATANIFNGNVVASNVSVGNVYVSTGIFWTANSVPYADPVGTAVAMAIALG